jgi:hypothetical protein
MIVYDLSCQCGAIFEGWFADLADFVRQTEEGLLSCPVCGGSNIRKILSPVRALGAKGGEEENSTQLAVPVAPEAKAATVFKALQQHVRNNFEDVGSRLAEESLKVRYGLAEARNLRGIATPAEEKMLAGEGIELVKIPMPGRPKGN